MSDVLQKLEKLAVIPMVAIEDAKDAGALAEALVTGGLPCAEITFRTDAAEEAMRTIAGRGDMLLGAGTVLTVEQVDRAVDAGATFIVSPGTNPKVVQRCVEKEIAVTPGVATPTDIELAMSFGLKVMKFFPAEAMGGLKMLKALSGPYGMVRFIPTGGVNAGNLPEYLQFPKVLACGGSWIARKEAIRDGKFDEIRQTAAEAVHIAAKARS
jgi:2-dehydro-3-deoxyphosphogluconate aldolase/(4S)-4-hydroxy-2-oxoglutarate aldolase